MRPSRSLVEGIAGGGFVVSDEAPTKTRAPLTLKAAAEPARRLTVTAGPDPHHLLLSRRPTSMRSPVMGNVGELS